MKPPRSKKKKSLHGFLADKNNPISMKEIVNELKKDRNADDDKVELSDEVKVQVEESRKRPRSEFKSQKEMEKKFLCSTV